MPIKRSPTTPTRPACSTTGRSSPVRQPTYTRANSRPRSGSWTRRTPQTAIDHDPHGQDLARAGAQRPGSGGGAASRRAAASRWSAAHCRIPAVGTARRSRGAPGPRPGRGRDAGPTPARHIPRAVRSSRARCRAGGAHAPRAGRRTLRRDGSRLARRANTRALRDCAVAATGDGARRTRTADLQGAIAGGNVLLRCVRLQVAVSRGCAETFGVLGGIVITAIVRYDHARSARRRKAAKGAKDTPDRAMSMAREVASNAGSWERPGRSGSRTGLSRSVLRARALLEWPYSRCSRAVSSDARSRDTAFAVYARILASPTVRRGGEAGVPALAHGEPASARCGGAGMRGELDG